ncbi:MAG: putative lipid II flippase FtsW [Eubacteriaceae bacterium]|jgi:cell division protein FtsW|nr:putative lipid II flippase FtsW [Eubacteriaceae bacterium]
MPKRKRTTAKTEKKARPAKRRTRYRFKKTDLGSGDFFLVILMYILVIFGVVMVFSSSYYSAINAGGTPYTYLIKDLFFAVTGTGLFLLMALIDYNELRKAAKIFMIIALLLLVAVLTPLGVTIQGAQRWISLGFTTIMPGEIAKICVVIFVAYYLSAKPGRVNSLKDGIIPMLLLAGLVGGLIMKQPNMSTAITIVVIIIMMMFVDGLYWRYLGGLVGLGIVGSLMLIFMSGSEYRLNRVVSFTDPFAQMSGNGYQVVQSLFALGSGGMFGVGLGNSIQKSLYLPEPQNDFILAIIGEELGYIGIIILMIVYILLIWRGILIAMHAPDRFGMLLAAGITLMIGIQVMMNIAVVTSSMPPTGVTLPFVSYGGNALWLFMGSAGILLNISRHKTIPKVEAQEEK